jgi:hypothetical protein
MRPSEIIDLLTPKFGRNFAHEVIYYIYQSPHINRFMFDDYLEIFNRSKFINKEVLPLFPTEVPEDILRQLTHKYGSFNFSHNGMLVVLKK